MTDRMVLDLDRLVVNVLPLRIILAVSAAVGVLLGITLVIAGAFAAVFASPIGFFAMIFATIAAASSAVKLLVIAFVAMLVIPLGAAVATNWRLKNAERFITEDCDAKPAPTNTEFGRIVAEMSEAAGLQTIPGYGIVENAFNAFAYSSSRSVGMVLLGRPLIKTLTVAEALAVVGHELGHIAMRDSERKMLAISHQEFLTSFLFLTGLKSIGRTLFGFIGEAALALHSREREFWADAVGAHVTSPEDMINALHCIEGRHKAARVERRYAALMFRPVNRLFSTHPTTAKRIEALERRTYLDRLPKRAAEAVPPKPAAEPSVFAGL